MIQPTNKCSYYLEETFNCSIWATMFTVLQSAHIQKILHIFMHRGEGFRSWKSLADAYDIHFAPWDLWTATTEPTFGGLSSKCFTDHSVPFESTKVEPTKHVDLSHRVLRRAENLWLAEHGKGMCWPYQCYWWSKESPLSLSLMITSDTNIEVTSVQDTELVTVGWQRPQ